MALTLPSVYGASPIVLQTTVLPTENPLLSPDLIANAFKHSGNLYPSAVTAPGGAPRIRFTTTFFEAYNLIGLKSLKLTAFEFYMAKFTDAVRLAGTARKYSLNTNALAHATIKSFSVSQGGILLCDVEVVLLSADGMTHPLLPADDGTIPTLAGQPALRSIGPHCLNGTNYASASSISCDLGNNLNAFASGGMKYPTVAMYEGGDPVFSVEDADAATMLSTLTLEGLAITPSFIAYFRDYTAGVLQTTGISMTVASARAIPGDVATPTQGPATSSFRVIGLSTSQTHPIVVATGATLPVPA